MSQVGKIDAGQVDPLAAPEIDARETPATADSAAPAQVADPALAAHIWRAHAADVGSAALEAKLAEELGVDYDPDYFTMEEFYQDMPSEVKDMDGSIAVAEGAFRGGAADGVVNEATKALKEAELGGRLLDSMMALAAELKKADADPALVVRLADEADARFLDFAAKGDPKARAIMAEHYGRSALGGGAFGNDVASVLAGAARAASESGTGAAAEQAPSAAPPAAAAQAPPARTETAARAEGEQAPAKPGHAPEGYGSLDAARSGAYIRSGSTGEQANALLRALNAAGAKPPLALDGKIGPEAEAAIRKFQAEHGCAVDGIVGPETLGALDAALGLEVKSQRGGWIPGKGGPGGAGAPGGAAATVPGTGAGAPGEADRAAPEVSAAPPAGSTSGAAARRAALSAATTQIGVREASGDNDGVPAARYSRGRNVPWCANFVSWAYRQAGNPLPGNQVAIGSCDQMATELKRTGAWYGKSQTPQPGDIIFFGTPGDLSHVGIVDHVSGGRVYTVEGNSGNRVASRSYPLDSSRIMGYARPR